jgi:hypothetical protein
VFNHFRFITGRTRSEAEAKAEEYARFRDVESRFFGLDLAKYPPETLLADVEIPDDASGRDRVATSASSSRTGQDSPK